MLPPTRTGAGGGGGGGGGGGAAGLGQTADDTANHATDDAAFDTGHGLDGSRDRSQA